MSSLKQLKSWFQAHSQEIKEDYFTFLRFKSISTDPAYRKDVLECAKWLSDYIAKHSNMKTEIIETKGYPIVFAQDMRAGKEASTLLAYGHYDVQPVDPIKLWKSDPFEPTERDGKIFARGAIDDKGQIFYAIAAVRAWKELGKELPINLKFCIEGEEECASIGLSDALPKLKAKLEADALLVIDFSQFDETTPAVSFGARGLVALEITLTGSKTDLHSGAHGGIAYNPNRAMAELLSRVWDENGRVRIKGFYDDVSILSETEMRPFAFGYEEKSYRKEFGIDAIGGEKGLTLAEKNGLRPTFEINGMSGGYTGNGFKTVIPAQAIAKISCRLVPNQDPKKIASAVIAFLKENVEPGMKIEIENLGGEEAFRAFPESKIAKAVMVASTEAMGKECKKILSGGSVPIMASMVKVLNVDAIGMGQGLQTDEVHAPNEHFDFQRFEYGFLTFARTLELL